MPGAKKNFIGLEGFIWWIGVVEDRQDPEQLGRVRVRCFGWHTEQKEKIPTNTLPWAHPVIPVNNPTVYTPKEGDLVFGFFADGDNAQNPMIVGILPGKPEKKPDYNNGFSDPGSNLGGRPKKPDDGAEAYPKSKYLKESTTNRLARGKPESTVIATRKKNVKKNVKSAGGVTWSEPNPAFAPKYPYNSALETESGHAFELDDTPGQERVHLAHRNGSFIEIDSKGNRVDRVQKDNYAVIMGDDFIYIKGKAAITVDGNFNLRTSTINIEAAAINMASDGDIRIKGKAVKIESTSGMDLKAGGVGNFTSGGKLSLKGSTAALAGAVVDIPAGLVNLKSGSAASASGTGLKGGGASPTSEESSEAANAATQNANTKANTAATANAVSTTGGTEQLTGVTVTGKRTAVGDGLEEVSVTGKRVGTSGGFLDSVSKAVSAVGKTVDGITSTVNSVVSKITTAADGVLQDFANKTPLGELVAKVDEFAGTVNDNRGSILSLKQDLKTLVVGKIADVATKAIENNINFDIDSDIQNAVNNYNNPTQAVVTKIGKHIFPLTETVPVSNANTSTSN